MPLIKAMAGIKKRRGLRMEKDPFERPGTVTGCTPARCGESPVVPGRKIYLSDRRMFDPNPGISTD